MTRPTRTKRVPRATCFIEGFHVQAYDTYDETELHQNLCWELNCFFEPGIRLRVGSTTSPWLDRPAGQLCLIPPGTPFWTSSQVPGKALRGAWISFVPTGMLDLERLVPLTVPYAVFDDPRGGVADLLDEWNRALSGMSEGDAVFARQHYARPLIELLQNAIPCAEGRYRILSMPESARTDVFVSRLRHYVRQHYMGPLRLADMARHVGVSPSCLSHRYARMTGDSPAALLLRTRIEVAARLMERGFHPKDIVGRTGFCDLPHLTRTFKQLMGQPPGLFRRMHAQRRQEDSSLAMPVRKGSRTGVSPSRRRAINAAAEWSEELHQSSALLDVSLLQRRRLNSDEHAHPCWVLDAFLTPGVGFRDSAAASVDRAHGPGWLRLYRPGLSYWEDDRDVRGIIRSYSLTFFVIRGSVFWQKYGGLDRALNIRDADGSGLSLIRKLLAQFPEYWTDPHRRGQITFHRLLRHLLFSQRARARVSVMDRPGRDYGR